VKPAVLAEMSNRSAARVNRFIHINQYISLLLNDKNKGVAGICNPTCHKSDLIFSVMPKKHLHPTDHCRFKSLDITFSHRIQS